MADLEEQPATTYSGQEATDEQNINNLTLESSGDDAFDEFYGEGSVRPNMSVPIKSSAGIFDNFQEAGFTEEPYLSDDKEESEVAVEIKGTRNDVVENISRGVEEIVETEEEATFIWKSSEDLSKRQSQEVNFVCNVSEEKNEQLETAENETPGVHVPEHEHTEESSGYYDGDTQPFECSTPKAKEESVRLDLPAAKGDEFNPVCDPESPELAESSSAKTTAALDSLVTFLDRTSSQSQSLDLRGTCKVASKKKVVVAEDGVTFSKKVDNSHEDELSKPGHCSVRMADVANVAEDEKSKSKLFQIDDQAQQTDKVDRDEVVYNADREGKDKDRNLHESSSRDKELITHLTSASKDTDDNIEIQRDDGSNQQLSSSSSDGALTLSATITRKSGVGGDGHTPLYDAAVSKHEAKGDEMVRILPVEEQKGNEEGEELTLTPSQILLTPMGKQAAEGKDGILSNDEVTSPKAPALPPRNKIVSSKSRLENEKNSSLDDVPYVETDKVFDKTSSENPSLKPAVQESISDSLASLPFIAGSTKVQKAKKDEENNSATKENHHLVAVSKAPSVSQTKQAPWLNVVRETSKTVPTAARVKKDDTEFDYGSPSSEDEEYMEAIRGTKRAFEDSSESSSEEELSISGEKEGIEEETVNKRKTVRWAANVNYPGKENDSQLSNSQLPAKALYSSSVLENLSSRIQMKKKSVDDMEDLRDTSEESDGESDASNEEDGDGNENENDANCSNKVLSQGEEELRAYQAEARASAAKQAAKSSQIAKDVKSLQRLVELEKRDRKHKQLEASLRQYISSLKKELVSCKSKLASQSRKHSILEDIKKSHAAQIASLEKEQSKLQETVLDLQAEVLSMQHGQQFSPENNYLCQKCLGVDDPQNDQLSVGDASTSTPAPSNTQNCVTPSTTSTTNTTESRSTQRSSQTTSVARQSTEIARISLDHEYNEAESFPTESKDSPVADVQNKDVTKAPVSLDCEKGSMKQNSGDIVNDVTDATHVQSEHRQQESSEGEEDFESEVDNDEEDTEALDEDRTMTLISQRRIANIINTVPADFRFMRDIFQPTWDILKQQGGTENSKWKWVSGTIDLPNHVFGAPHGKGVKKGLVGVDFFVTELDLVSKLVDEMERCQIKLQSRNVEKIRKLHSDSKTDQEGKRRRKRRTVNRSTPALSTKTKKPSAKQETAVVDAKEERQEIEDTSNIFHPLPSDNDTDDDGCELSDCEGSIMEIDNEELAAGQIMTRKSMRKCAIIYNKFSISGQLRRDLFIPIWGILQNQGGEDRNNSWDYVKISDPLLPNFGWAVPRCRSVHDGVQGKDYFVSEIDLVVAVCRNIITADACLVKEYAWKEVMKIKSETESSSSGTRRTRKRRLASTQSNVPVGTTRGTSKAKKRKGIELLISKPKKTKRGTEPKANAEMEDNPMTYSQNAIVGATALLNMSRTNNDREDNCRATQSDDIPLVKLSSEEKFRKADGVKGSAQTRSPDKSTGSLSSLTTAETRSITEDVSKGVRSPTASSSVAELDSLVITQEGITRLLNFRKKGSLMDSQNRKEEDSCKGELLILQNSSAMSPKNKFDAPDFHMTQDSPEKGSISFQSPLGSRRKIHDGLLKGITFLTSGVDQRLKGDIRALGGSIAESIADVPSMKDGDQRAHDLILLSHHRSRRSIKYLFAASMAVPMVHFHWLQELQLREKKYQSGDSSVRPNPFDEDLFASTRLPLGLSLNSGRYRLQPVDVLKTRHVRKRILADMTFAIVMANEKSEIDWSIILEASGGTIVKSAPTAGQKIDAILVDSIFLPPLETAVPEKLNKAFECFGHDIPVIDLSWAVQCIVEMRRLRFDHRSKLDVGALQSSNARQIFTMKRKEDGVRFEVGDIVSVQHKSASRSGHIFARIVSFVSSSGRSRSCSHKAKVEVLEQHERCLVDGGDSAHLTCDISNIRKHVLLLKGKDFRQIEGIYGHDEDVFVQKMKSRRKK